MTATVPSMPVQTPEHRFLGTWGLVSAEAIAKDGTKVPLALLGPNGKAYLIYTPDHHVFAILMNPQRTPWASSAPTDAEARSALDGFYAYCGTFDVNSEESYVRHHLELALSPNDVGRDWKRHFSFDGELLTLRPMETDSNFSGGSLTWARVK